MFFGGFLCDTTVWVTVSQIGKNGNADSLTVCQPDAATDPVSYPNPDHWVHYRQTNSWDLYYIAQYT